MPRRWKQLAHQPPTPPRLAGGRVSSSLFFPRCFFRLLAPAAFAFASGMAALTAATRLVSVGGTVLAGDDIYGGTSRLLSKVLPSQGVGVANVDMTDLQAVKTALGQGGGSVTQLVLIESPTNPRLQVRRRDWYRFQRLGGASFRTRRPSPFLWTPRWWTSPPSAKWRTPRALSSAWTTRSWRPCCRRGSR